ncbi:RNA 2',3'-cyclic phosphodiesterase [Carboxylicivirga sp. RSCT41]|uniref:RNA 2',3'-cyclic phosphodiesterase n=1 Tax=Carboxylicivirga agarovorans TaxID=3417570 RepID=UPI003D33C98E
MRLFVAIDCDRAKNELVLAQKEFATLNARFTQSFHLTLLFIGKVDNDNAEVIIDKLRTVPLTPFELHLTQLNTFKSHAQKVIWCGVNESQPLLQLHEDISKAIYGEKTIHKYSPHITLARVKNYRSLTNNEKIVLDRGLKKEVTACSFEVRHFVLYESRSSPGGPIYKVLKKY